GSSCKPGRLGPNLKTADYADFADLERIAHGFPPPTFLSHPNWFPANGKSFTCNHLWNRCNLRFFGFRLNAHASNSEAQDNVVAPLPRTGPEFPSPNPILESPPATGRIP